MKHTFKRGGKADLHVYFFPSQGLLLKEKGVEAQSLDQVIQQKNLPENQQEAFKTGFAEGFMRSHEALTQRTQGMWSRQRHTYLFFIITVGGSAELSTKMKIG